MNPKQISTHVISENLKHNILYELDIYLRIYETNITYQYNLLKEIFD